MPKSPLPNEFLQRRIANLLNMVSKMDKELEERKARMRDAAERFDKILDRIQKMEEQDALNQLSSKRDD